METFNILDGYFEKLGVFRNRKMEIGWIQPITDSLKLRLAKALFHQVLSGHSLFPKACPLIKLRPTDLAKAFKLETGPMAPNVGISSFAR